MLFAPAWRGKLRIGQHSRVKVIFPVFCLSIWLAAFSCLSFDSYVPKGSFRSRCHSRRGQCSHAVLEKVFLAWRTTGSFVWWVSCSDDKWGEKVRLKVSSFLTSSFSGSHVRWRRFQLPSFSRQGSLSAFAFLCWSADIVSLTGAIRKGLCSLGSVWGWSFRGKGKKEKKERKMKQILIFFLRLLPSTNIVGFLGKWQRRQLRLL